jgi:hypothetical protein
MEIKKIIKNLIINLLLVIVAIILLVPLIIVNLIVVLIKYWDNGFLKTLSSYFLETAIDIDRFGNRNLRTILNLTMIKADGYKFGNISETISKVLGINKANKKLTKFGCLICKILHIFDKNHCEKSANI